MANKLQNAIANQKPNIGDKYLWQNQPRQIVLLKIVDIVRNDITIKVETYLGPHINNNTYVNWTREEWDHATNSQNFWYYPTDAHQPDENTCPACNGTKFETMRDLEVTVCLYCGGTGTAPNAYTVQTPATYHRRSPLHPIIPTPKSQTKTP